MDPVSKGGPRGTVARQKIGTPPMTATLLRHVSRATVSNIQQDFGITLPASFNDAVRTTTEAACSYVIPAQTAKVGQLNAYVRAAFLTPTQNPRITTILCMNIQPGQIRPADPQLVLGSLVVNPTGRIVQCGDASIEVAASIVNE
jgi:hypothetical protein